MTCKFIKITLFLFLFPASGWAQVHLYSADYYVHAYDQTKDTYSYKLINENLRNPSFGEFIRPDSVLRLMANNKVIIPDTLFESMQYDKFIIPGKAGVVLFNKRYPETEADIKGILFQPSAVKPLQIYHDRYNWQKFVLNDDTLWFAGRYAPYLQTFHEVNGTMNQKMQVFNQRFLIFEAMYGEGQIMIIDSLSDHFRISYVATDIVQLDHECSGLNAGINYDEKKKVYNFYVGSSNPPYSFAGSWDGKYLEFTEKGDVRNYVLYVNERKGIRKLDSIEAPWITRERQQIKNKLINKQGIRQIRSWQGKYFVAPQKNPEFPGGEAAMKKYIVESIEYPDSAQKKRIVGTVDIRFLVLPTGALDSISVLKGIGFGCDIEAIRVLKDFPKWKSGMYKGKPIYTEMKLSIYFSPDYINLKK